MTRKLPSSHYENNPFFVASNGITLLLGLAQGVGIFFIILSVIGLFGSPNSGESDDINERAQTVVRQVSEWSLNEWLILTAVVLIVGMAVLLLSALVSGVSSYTSYRLSKGSRVRFTEAFSVSFEHLWSYLWLQILVFLKIFLWSLLLIIPGIIMAVRYSLAGVAFYDDTKELRGNAAIKESLKLTKNAWFTTFASSALFNLITFGVISSVINTGVNAVLYNQYDYLGDKPKPAAHWLSWFTLALPFILIAFAFAFLFGILLLAWAIGQLFAV